MNTVQLLETADGDWSALIFNDKVLHEGHSIPDFVWLDLLSDLDCYVQRKIITTDEALDRTYKT